MKKPSRFAVKRVRELALRCEISLTCESRGLILHSGLAQESRQRNSEYAFSIAGLYGDRPSTLGDHE